ncbi:hypothetical protein UlMin_031837 [Ulmus minor]
MAFRFRRFRESSSLLARTFSGDEYIHCKRPVNFWALSKVPRFHAWDTINRRIFPSGFHSQRFSTASKVLKKSTLKCDILPFIKSSLCQLEGPYHCWLNKFEGGKDLFKKDGTFLVLAGHFSEDSLKNGHEHVIFFEKVKLLQRRFPHLHVMGFQSGSFNCTAADRSNLVQSMVKENITFPVLLSNKNFPEVANGVCYILFKDFWNPIFYDEKALDFEVLKKAIEELGSQHNGNSHDILKKTSPKQYEIIKEPNLCSLRNSLFYFPGCISADEDGNRLFISDCNHHRVIILNGNGKILDCIGSSPGFEDGDFESAKLMRPAASFYDADEDCLYIVDSENHAIRRADIKERVLETICPASNTNKKNNKIWTWIMDKLGYGSNIDTKPDVFDTPPLTFPWHLIKSTDDSLLIINKSFETLWILDLASGEVKEDIKGFPKVLEICGQQILEKVSHLKQMPHDWLQQQANAVYSPEGLPYAGLISSMTTLQDHQILCDMVGQRILKLSGECEVSSNFHISNFRILGLPYWLSSPLESVYNVADGLLRAEIDHLQCFSLLPGKVDIKINADIPKDTELVEQLQEGCIWRQARGVAIVVPELENVSGSSEKVGSAQKWFDELDNLVFSTPESELSVVDDDTTSDIRFEDDKVHINVTVNTSPGTSEIIVNAVLYLKLRREPVEEDDNQEKYAARIVNILNSGKGGKFERDSCIQFLLKAKRDLRDFIFSKPLHVRIKLDTLDHPKSDRSKEVIFTDSSIEVNVSLNW